MSVPLLLRYVVDDTERSGIIVRVVNVVADRLIRRSGDEADL